MMNKFLRCFIALIVIAIFMITPISVEAAKKTIAVMPLENISGYTEQRVAEIMTEQLVVVLRNSGAYNVVERLQMGTILKETGFQSISADPSSAVKVGKVSGAQYSLIGKVTRAEVITTAATDLAKRLFGKKRETILMHGYRGKISLDFRIVNNETGETVFVAVVEGTKSGKTQESVLHDACQDAAENALKKIQEFDPFIARIEKVNGSNIYIDQGADSGLRKGEILKIAREGSPIEIRGKIVGMTHNDIGKAKVIEIYPEYAVCTVVEITGSVRSGDIVKRS